MLESIINPTDLNVNSPIRTIRAFDRRGVWAVKVVFEDGTKATSPASADEVNRWESQLGDLGWTVDPSLFHRGFNAKPPVVEIEDDQWVMPFRSGLGQWIDNYAIEGVAL